MPEFWISGNLKLSTKIARVSMLITKVYRFLGYFFLQSASVAANLNACTRDTENSILSLPATVAFGEVKFV